MEYVQGYPGLIVQGGWGAARLQGSGLATRYGMPALSDQAESVRYPPEWLQKRAEIGVPL